MPGNMPDRHLSVKPAAAEYAYLGVEQKIPPSHTRDMDRVRIIRESRGLTQKQLAELIGANQGTISKIEKGLANPTQTMVARLASALGVEAIDLFDIGALQARALDALSKMTPERREAALLVLEAMAQQSGQ